MDEVTIYRFQPDAMDRKTLEKIFVGEKRKRLLQKLYKEITKAVGTHRPKYYLIVGPRGIGKTHFATLLYYRLLSGVKEIRLVKLSEEEFSVYRVSDLLQRVLETVKEDKTISRDFEKMSNDDVVAASLEELRGFKESIILFIENLNQIIGEQMDETEVKRLRSILQKEDRFIIVATAPLMFPEISSHEEPFFNFFELVYLLELTRDELKELLRRLAKMEKNKNFLEEIGKFEHRIDAIATLTGGNPRIAILLYDLTKTGKMLDVERAFFKILDDNTPYYQDVFRMLTGQRRKIFDELIAVGEPATPKELALRTRLSQSVVNSQMRRLERDGYVISHKIGRETKYEVRERLFRLWRELRKEPLGKERLSILIKFLEVWYSSQEREEMFLKCFKDLEKTEGDLVLKEASYWFLSLPYQLRENLMPTLVRESYKLGKAAVLGALIQGEKLKVMLVETRGRFLIESGKYEELLEILDKDFSAVQNHAEFWELRASVLAQLGRLEESLQAATKAVELDPNDASAWAIQIEVLHKLNRNEEALQIATKAVELDPKNLRVWKDKVAVLLDLDKNEEALQATSKAIEINPDDSSVWVDRGRVLRTLKRENEANEAFLKVISIVNEEIKVNPRNFTAWLDKAIALAGVAKFRDTANASLKAAELTLSVSIKQSLKTTASRCFLIESLKDFEGQNIGNATENLKRAIGLIQNIRPTEKQEETALATLTPFLAEVTNLRNTEALRIAVGEISDSLEFSKDFLKPFKMALEIVESGDTNKYYNVQIEIREVVTTIVAKLIGSNKLAPPKNKQSSQDHPP